MERRLFAMLITDMTIRRAILADLPAMTEIYNYEVIYGRYKDYLHEKGGMQKCLNTL